VNLLVTFKDGHFPGLGFVTMADELEAILGRQVDLLIWDTAERDENPIRRQSILSCIEPLYVV
jgi:predicted nucleotidyltransferase